MIARNAASVLPVPVGETKRTFSPGRDRAARPAAAPAWGRRGRPPQNHSRTGPWSDSGSGEGRRTWTMGLPWPSPGGSIDLRASSSIRMSVAESSRFYRNEARQAVERDSRRSLPGMIPPIGPRCLVEPIDRKVETTVKAMDQEFVPGGDVKGTFDSAAREPFRRGVAESLPSHPPQGPMLDLQGGPSRFRPMKSKSSLRTLDRTPGDDRLIRGRFFHVLELPGGTFATRPDRVFQPHQNLGGRPEQGGFLAARASRSSLSLHPFDDGCGRPSCPPSPGVPGAACPGRPAGLTSTSSFQTRTTDRVSEIQVTRAVGEQDAVMSRQRRAVGLLASEDDGQAPDRASRIGS